MSIAAGLPIPPRVHVTARLALLLGLLAVLVLVEAPERTRFWDAVFDAGHAPLFGLAALLVRRLLATWRPAWTESRLSWAAFAATLVGGGATELLQLLQPTRAASAGDLLRDAAGAGAFLLLRTAWRRETARGPRTAPHLPGARAAFGVALLGAVAAPLLLVVAQNAARDRAFPTLFRLDGSWWERPLVSAGNAEFVPALAGQGIAPTSQLARLSLRPGQYPGLVLDEPYPDWRGRERLTFTVVSALDAPLTLTIRINDAAHNHRYPDRFNRRLVIEPGENRIEIHLDEVRRAPGGREMDMRRIRLIVLYAYRLDRPVTLRLGPFRVE